MIPVRVLSDKLDGKLRVFAARVESRLALVSTAARPDLYAAKILSKNKDYIQIQTFPFSGFPASALKSVMDSKTVIANARTKVTSTNHTNRAVRVLRSRVTLTPQLASTRRPCTRVSCEISATRRDRRTKHGGVKSSRTSPRPGPFRRPFGLSSALASAAEPEAGISPSIPARIVPRRRERTSAWPSVPSLSPGAGASWRMCPTPSRRSARPAPTSRT